MSGTDSGNLRTQFGNNWHTVQGSLVNGGPPVSCALIARTDIGMPYWSLVRDGPRVLDAILEEHVTDQFFLAGWLAAAADMDPQGAQFRRQLARLQHAGKIALVESRGVIAQPADQAAERWAALQRETLAAFGDDRELPCPEIARRMPGASATSLRTALVALLWEKRLEVDMPSGPSDWDTMVWRRVAEA